MKLYTEEQVKIAYSKGNNDGYCGIQRDFEQLHLLPIELPSDDKMANASNTCKEVDVKKGFLRGVLWYQEQILNQNK